MFILFSFNWRFLYSFGFSWRSLLGHTAAFHCKKNCSVIHFHSPYFALTSACFCWQMANEVRPCPCDIGDRMEYGGFGLEVQVEHVKAYVVKPTLPSDKAVIVIQDIFGWQLPNTRYIADLLAANGYMYVKGK